jgi:hypothetical protein
MFLAILFIVLGLFALLNALGIIVGANFWSLIWAVVLLAIGFRLLRRRGKCPICGWNHFEAKMHQKFNQKTHGDCCGNCDHDHDEHNHENHEEAASN